MQALVFDDTAARMTAARR